MGWLKPVQIAWFATRRPRRSSAAGSFRIGWREVPRKTHFTQKRRQIGRTRQRRLSISGPSSRCPSSRSGHRTGMVCLATEREAGSPRLHWPGKAGIASVFWEATTRHWPCCFSTTQVKTPRRGVPYLTCRTRSPVVRHRTCATAISGPNHRTTVTLSVVQLLSVNMVFRMAAWPAWKA